MAAISALLGFGGLCVHMQVLSSLHMQLSYPRFLCFRILQAVIAALLSLMLF